MNNRRNYPDKRDNNGFNNQAPAAADCGGAVELALGNELLAGWSIPVIATVLWAVLFLGAALWRFDREEF